MRLYPNPKPKTTETSPTVQDLQGIMDRLCAADLTVPESQDLRHRLHRLLETIEAEDRRRRAESGPAERRSFCDARRCLIV